MNIKYKYFDLKILEAFIKEPTFKLTRPKQLNDPFECAINDEIIDLYKQNINQPTEDMFTIQSAVNNALCIISLTSTNDNKLMWAHYGDEHRGVAIGFDVDKLNKHISETNKKNKGALIDPTTLCKVEYKEKRFDISQGEMEEIKSLNSEKLINNIIQKVATTKSIEWNYELEYRYILPISFCDILQLLSRKARYINSSWSNKAKIRFSNNANWKDKFRIIENFKHSHETIELMKIPKECIHSIHFGARVEPADEYKILNEIKKHPEYSKIKTFRYKLCTKDFKLSILKSQLPSSKEIDELFAETDKLL
ncbi:DUF2971 domain-containing protein [Aeromonas rivipollensis]